MGPYILLVIVLVGLMTPVFWTLGFKTWQAFLIASGLVLGSAIVGSAWTKIALRLVGI